MSDQKYVVDMYMETVLLVEPSPRCSSAGCYIIDSRTG